MSREARALVVDDDGAIRFMIGKILEREGFTVDEARDGNEAIEKIKNGDYAMVLLDLMMPRTDGFQVLKSISAVDPERLDRIIVMTALSAEYLRESVPHVIYKPFDLDRLTGYARQFRANVVAQDESLAG